MPSQFTPLYIFEAELTSYGLPDVATFPDILNLVQFASAFLDEECGRIDGDGNGSLAYTTFFQRILLQTRNRNLIQLPMKPIVGITQATVDVLVALAAASGNHYYSGVIANTVNQPNGDLSGVVAASGRYGYVRQDQSVGYPDLWAPFNPMTLVTIFGGPAPWVALDVSAMDYDAKTGEAWIPAGLQLQRYSEVLIQYNAGYDPRSMPPVLKHVCASLVKNAMAKGNATTAMLGLTLGKSGANATFGANLMDPTLDRMLTPYRNIRAY